MASPFLIELSECENRSISGFEAAAPDDFLAVIANCANEGRRGCMKRACGSSFGNPTHQDPRPRDAGNLSWGIAEMVGRKKSQSFRTT